MYDSRFAGFFLRCSDGRIWHRRRDSKGGSCGPGTPADPKGDIFFWNFSNASAATYFVEQVVLGWRGAGNSAIDGVFLDDPGPGTAAHAMDEYRATLSAAVIGIGIGAAHLATLAHATVATVARAQSGRMESSSAIHFHPLDCSHHHPPHTHRAARRGAIDVAGGRRRSPASCVRNSIGIAAQVPGGRRCAPQRSPCMCSPTASRA